MSMTDQVVKTGKRRWWILFVLFTMSAVDPAALQRIPQLSAFFVPELGFTVEQVGQLNVSGNIGQIPMAILGGILAARFGPKPFLIIAGVGMLVLPVSIAFAQEFWQMYLLEVLIGAALGFIIPAAVLMIARWFPAKDAPGPMAMFAAALLLATVFVNPLNLFIATNLGWRNVYLIMAIPSLIVLLLIFTTSNGPAVDKRVSEAEKRYILSGQVTVSGGSFSAALKLLLTPRLILLILAVALTSGASGQLTWVWYATLGTLQVPSDQVALVTSIGFLISGLYSFIHQWVVNHVFRGSLNASIATGAVIGILAFISMNLFFTGMWVVWALMVCIPACLMISLTMATARAYINADAGPAATGAGVGVISAIGLTIGFFAVSASGSWLDTSAEGLAIYNPIWYAAAGMVVPVLVVALLIKRINVRRLDLDGDGTPDTGADVEAEAEAERV